MIQIQRVRARRRRAARSAMYAPIDSSSVTMITYSIQANIYFSLLTFAFSASRSRIRWI